MMISVLNPSMQKGLNHCQHQRLSTPVLVTSFLHLSLTPIRNAVTDVRPCYHDKYLFPIQSLQLSTWAGTNDRKLSKRFIVAISSHRLPIYSINNSAMTMTLTGAALSQVRITNDVSTLRNNVIIRRFRNVSEYHDVADETLLHINDAIDEFIEDIFESEQNNSATREDEKIPEVNNANGVLTIHLPPHGTWVINKQTPNQQLWWSSPISGPRRYEFIEERRRWVYTRVVEGGKGSITSSSVVTGVGEEDTLGQILSEEINELYGYNLQLKA